MSNFLARFAGAPALISASEHDFRSMAAAAEASWMAHGSRLESDAAVAEGFWPAPGSYMAQFRPYVVSEGVLQVPVKGILLNDFPFAFGAWATGYEYLSAAFERGLSDRSVHTIAMIVNSPGGMVTGCFEAADAIFAARGAKRIVAYVADSAYSAAYALASSASEIVTTRTAGVGSIGVVTYHIDASGAYAMEGLRKTYIFAGKHKVDGNESEPLPDDVKARIEERLQASYEVFVSTVARNRAMSAEDVRATEALTYTASTAIEVGLSDRIGTYSDALWPPLAETLEGDEDMAKENQAEITAEDLAAAVTEAHAAGVKAGTDAERARIAAILTHESATERPAAAKQAAFSLGLDVEKAAAFLAAMPEEKTAKSSFVRDMDTAGGAGLSGNLEQDTKPSRAAAALNLVKSK